MGIFNWGKEAEGIGNGIGTAAESIILKQFRENEIKGKSNE